jgi:hypothetical protein
MREPRRQSGAGNDGIVGNTNQPEVKPTRVKDLITSDWGPVFGAVITAAASLLIYSFNQIRHIDERLDTLEQEARILFNEEGGPRPSKEALESFYRLDLINRRLERLEGTL